MSTVNEIMNQRYDWVETLEPGKHKDLWKSFYDSWFNSNEGISALNYLSEHDTLEGWKY